MTLEIKILFKGQAAETRVVSFYFLCVFLCYVFKVPSLSLTTRWWRIRMQHLVSLCHCASA